MPNGAIDHGQVHGLLDGFFDAHPLRMPYFGKFQASSCVRFEDVYPTLLTVYHMLRYVKPTPFILFTEFLYTRIKVESHPDLHHWFPFHRPLDTEFDTFVCASLSYVSTKPAAMHSRV